MSSPQMMTMLGFSAAPAPAASRGPRHARTSAAAIDLKTIDISDGWMCRWGSRLHRPSATLRIGVVDHSRPRRSDDRPIARARGKAPGRGLQIRDERPGKETVVPFDPNRSSAEIEPLRRTRPTSWGGDPRDAADRSESTTPHSRSARRCRAMPGREGNAKCLAISPAESMPAPATGREPPVGSDLRWRPMRPYDSTIVRRAHRCFKSQPSS